MGLDLDLPLPATPLGAAFAAAGCRDVGDAFRFVHGLPYGRNSHREGRSDAHDDEVRVVLDEGRGTCSSKHVLLARLAAEAHLGAELRLGLFLMDGENTPAVAEVLARAGLRCVPEAHCFLQLGARRLDLTFPGSDGTCGLAFVEERGVAPEMLGRVKVPWHQEHLGRWARAAGLDAAWVWDVREACIAALSARAA